MSSDTDYSKGELSSDTDYSKGELSADTDYSKGELSADTDYSNRELSADADGLIANTGECDTDGEVLVIKQRWCCHLPPSPYPMYLANVFCIAAYYINSLLLQDLLYNKICYQKFQNLSLCTDSTFSTKHPELQEVVVKWYNYHSALSIPLTMLLNLMLSSYCDKIGHKLPYLLPCLGTALSAVYLAVIASPQFITWPLPTIFVFSIVSSAFGSFPTILMTSFSYCGLVARVDNRSLVMGLCEASILVGVFIGNLITGPIIDSIGLPSMAYINAGISLLPLPVVLILLTDVTTEANLSNNWRNVVKLAHILDAFKCVFKKREGSKRLRLNLVFVSYTCIFMASAGASGNSFLYLVKSKGFSLTLYSVFNSYSAILKTISCPLILYVCKRFIKPQEHTIGLVAISCAAIGYIIVPIDILPYSVWIGVTFFSLDLLAYAVIRSIQLSCCEKNELGLIFAYDAIIQSTFGLTGSIGIKALYSATLTTWNGMYLAICALLTIISLSAFVWLSLLKLREKFSN